MKITAVIDPGTKGPELDRRERVLAAKDAAEAEKVIVLGSGDFSPRGIPCAEDRYEWAEMWTGSGADAALALPICAVLSGPGVFAFSAVMTLTRFRMIDSLILPDGEEELYRMNLERAYSSVRPVALKAEERKEEPQKGLSPSGAKALAELFEAKKNSFPEKELMRLLEETPGGTEREVERALGGRIDFSDCPENERLFALFFLLGIRKSTISLCGLRSFALYGECLSKGSGGGAVLSRIAEESWIPLRGSGLNPGEDEVLDRIAEFDLLGERLRKKLI